MKVSGTLNNQESESSFHTHAGAPGPPHHPNKPPLLTHSGPTASLVIPCTNLTLPQVCHFVHVGLITAPLLSESDMSFKTQFKSCLHHVASPGLLI